MKHVKEKKFEENYFEGWFKGAVGKFGQKDLNNSKKWFWSWLKKLNQYIPLDNGQGKKVLEIGCSIGGVSSLLVEKGFDVYASDVSEYAINKARKISPNISFSVFDIEGAIPFKSKFDIIIAFEVVEHLKNPQKAIENMYFMVKKGGYIVFSTPYPYKWIFSDPTHINVKQPSEWIKIMKLVGIKNPHYHRFSLLPYFYRFNKNFQLVIPFPIAMPYINSPIFYIGRKDE